jgi:hypothetical protein
MENTVPVVTISLKEKKFNTYFSINPKDLNYFPPRKSLISSTYGVILQPNKALAKTKIPFGISLHPFSLLTDSVPSIATTPHSCSKCEGILNPFCTTETLDTNLDTWKCNMCQTVNKQPPNLATKLQDSPELQHHVIDYIDPLCQPKTSTGSAFFDRAFIFVIDLNIEQANLQVRKIGTTISYC